MTARHFGLISSRRPTLRGADTSAGSHGADTRANSEIPFPSGSIGTRSATFEAPDLPDSFRNVVGWFFFLLLLSSIAALFGAIVGLVRAFIGA